MSTTLVEEAKERLYKYIGQHARDHIHQCKLIACEMGLEREMISTENAKSLNKPTSGEARLHHLQRPEMLEAMEVSFNHFSQIFYGLLWNRQCNEKPSILKDLDTVVFSSDFRTGAGLLFINRYFYSACNKLQLYPALGKHVAALIKQLEQLEGSAQGREKRILQEQVRSYRASHHAKRLRRQMKLNETEKLGQKDQVGDYLQDWFFLYRSTIRTPDIEELEKEEQNSKIGLKIKQYRKVHQDYCHYAYYLRGEDNIPVPIQGMSALEFKQNLNHYQPQRQGSFYQSAEPVRTHLPNLSSDEAFSRVIVYVKAPCHPLPAAVRSRFNRGLRKAFEDHTNTAYLGKPGMIKVFQRILQNILLPSEDMSGVRRFKENVQQAGAKSIVSVVLSIVLACPMVRFELEEILGFLYEKFESCKITAEKWIIDFFQHMNLALVANARELFYVPNSKSKA